MRSRLWTAVSLAGVLWAAAAAAEPPPADSEAAHARAGHPECHSCLAVPADTGSYVGYQLGGGCPYPHRADAPLPVEGTWGWDYQGCLLPRRVILGWWHGRRYQGGMGAYQNEGPRVLHHRSEEPAR
jgi:hypothetical protein